MIQYVKCACGGEHKIYPEDLIQPLTKLRILCPVEKIWMNCVVLIGVDETREGVVTDEV